MSETPGDVLTTSVLLSQREGLRALLVLLERVPTDHRARVRAGCVQALGAIEDALGLERTLPTRADRREQRAHLHGVVE